MRRKVELFDGNESDFDKVHNKLAINLISCSEQSNPKKIYILT